MAGLAKDVGEARGRDENFKEIGIFFNILVPKHRIEFSDLFAVDRSVSLSFAPTETSSTIGEDFRGLVDFFDSSVSAAHNSGIEC